MQSNAIRSMWLNSLWEVLHDKLAFTSLPAHVMATCGFPSRSARGAAERRRPAELLCSEWRGNPEEHGMLSIHPERLSSETETAKSMIWAAGLAMGGHRGPHAFGIYKDGADLKYTENPVGRRTAQIVRETLAELGEMPSGKGTLPSNERRQTTRNRLWTCPKHPHLKIRIASDSLGADLKHDPVDAVTGEHFCGATLILAPPSKKKGKK